MLNLINTNLRFLFGMTIGNLQWGAIGNGQFAMGGGNRQWAMGNLQWAIWVEVCNLQ
jgi:hypothetical protein